MSKRRYIDGCAMAQALDLIGERWALLVVRELMTGPKRFTDLRAALPGIGPGVLSGRLADLVANFIVAKHRLPKPTSCDVYQVTEWGRDLGPVMKSLGRWGARSPVLQQAPMSVAAFIMSLETMFDPSRASGIEMRVGMQFDDETFLATINADGLEISRSENPQPQVMVRGDQNDFADVIYGDQSIRSDLEVDGDRNALQRFVTLFSRPEPVLPVAQYQ